MNSRREEVIAMLDVLVTLAVGVVSTAIGTVIGNYIYDRWLKR